MGQVNVMYIFIFKSILRCKKKYRS